MATLKEIHALFCKAGDERYSDTEYLQERYEELCTDLWVDSYGKLEYEEYSCLARRRLEEWALARLGEK